MRAPRKSTADRKVNVEKGKKGFQPKTTGKKAPAGSTAPLPEKTLPTDVSTPTNISAPSISKKAPMVTTLGSKKSKFALTIENKNIDANEIKKFASEHNVKPWNKTAELVLAMFDKDVPEDQRTLDNLQNFVEKKCDDLKDNSSLDSTTQSVSHQDNTVFYAVHPSDTKNAKIDVYVTSDAGFYPESDEEPVLYKKNVEHADEAVKMSEGLYEDYNYDFARWN